MIIVQHNGQIIRLNVLVEGMKRKKDEKDTCKKVCAVIHQCWCLIQKTELRLKILKKD